MPPARWVSRMPRVAMCTTSAVAAAAEPADGAAVVFGQLAQGGQIGAVGKLNVMRGGGGQGEGGAVNQRVVVLEGEHGFQAVWMEKGRIIAGYAKRGISGCLLRENPAG